MTDDLELPHPADLMNASQWLRVGAPAAHRGHDPVKAVRTLLDLLERLPAHFDRYCYGTDTQRRLMELDP